MHIITSVVGSWLLMLSVAAAESVTPTIVDCTAVVPSVKRGVCANQLSADDFRALAPGVSWYYNWHYSPSFTPPAGVAMEFLPMVWGSGPERLTGLEKYLAAGNHPRRILAINEPNLKGQAFINPQQTAALFTQIATVAARAKITVVGPNMALGSPPKDSIVADDPIEKKSLTYTFMTPFLKAFLHFAEPTPVAELGVHTYGNLGEFTWLVGMLYKEFNRPLWVTEFAWWNAPNEAAEREYMIQAVDLMERSEHVQGYAWFKERADKHSISLLEKESGKLTPLGEIYVHLPVHSQQVAYRLPGRLQAECYVTASGVTLKETTDSDGRFQLAGKGNISIGYQVAPVHAGRYQVSLRVSGSTSGLKVCVHDQPAVTIPDSTGDWRNVVVEMPLAAGPQILEVVGAGTGLEMNWLEFTGM